MLNLLKDVFDFLLQQHIVTFGQHHQYVTSSDRHLADTSTWLVCFAAFQSQHRHIEPFAEVYLAHSLSDDVRTLLHRGLCNVTLNVHPHNYINYKSFMLQF